MANGVDLEKRKPAHHYRVMDGRKKIAVVGKETRSRITICVKIYVNQIIIKNWFLPHFGVSNVKLAFDAAAKSNSISLNDKLETGPELLQFLPGIIMQFRRFAIACKGNIANMFLLMKIMKEDREA